MIAMATAASAAAMATINRVKKTPSSLPGYRYLLKATKLMFAAVKDQLHRHQHRDQIPPRKQAIHADKKERSADDQGYGSRVPGSFAFRFCFHRNDDAADHGRQQQDTDHFKRQYITMFRSAQQLRPDIAHPPIRRATTIFMPGGSTGKHIAAAPQVNTKPAQTASADNTARPAPAPAGPYPIAG